MIAPMVAAKNHSVAFIVLMAGPGLPADEIIIAQRRLILAAMGVSADAIASGEEVERKVLDAAEQPGSEEEARAKVHAILAASAPTMSTSIIAAQAAFITSPWARFFLTYDPVPALKAVRCPVLAVAGSKDLQVPPNENLAVIKAALVGNPDVEIVELPGLRPPRQARLRNMAASKRPPRPWRSIRSRPGS
jgi:pimeloyl-ACP methyl ester carboxylesterase